VSTGDSGTSDGAAAPAYPTDARAAGEGGRPGAPEGRGEERRKGPPGGEGRASRPLRIEGLPEAVPCPHCDGEETEQFAAFGSAVSVSQYYCRDCRTVFECFRSPS